MHHVPKLIVAIPAIIVVMAIFMRANGRLAQNTTRKVVPPPPSIVTQPPASDTGFLQSFAPGSSSNTQVDLEGPWVCSYQSEDLDIEAQIEQKQVAARITSTEEITHLIVAGDCLYTWKAGTRTGQQVCSIGQYLSLFEMFSSLLSPDLLLSALPQLQGSVDMNEATMTSIMNSCTKQAVDASAFSMPTGITFAETEIGELQP